MYKRVLSVKRVQKSSISRNKNIDDFYSDRSRIIYCPSFRRLQQKAQLFSLETNSNVTTRMTHSLEVSDIGRNLANGIGAALFDTGKIEEREIPQIVTVVENACLLHDIGNPPFGHFGESAIRDWAEKYLVKYTEEYFGDKYKTYKEIIDKLLLDFHEFDGNPQGFRIVTKLITDRDKSSLNLTSATLMCILKYARSTDKKNDIEEILCKKDTSKAILKKPGYFQTEEKVVKEIRKNTGTKKYRRYPLTYIMEAADDIAYSFSDIADGIEKRVITLQEFIETFSREWETKFPDKQCPIDSTIVSFKHGISIPLTRKFIESAINNYINNHDDFYSGKADSLLPQDVRDVLDIIKKVAIKHLYNSVEAESIELTGYAVITGILKRYERVIRLDKDIFKKILNDEKVDNKELEVRLIHRIGNKYKAAYNWALKDLEATEFNEDLLKIYEYWLRVHLLVDHVDGMTDDYALRTYQMLKGIEILKV